MQKTDLTFRKYEYAARSTVPQILFVVLLMLDLRMMPLAGDIRVTPYFVLMAVYYWAIYRPTLIPAIQCFATGILMDVMLGAPLGMNALILTVVQWQIKSQRRFLTGQSYIAIWAVFGAVLVITGFAEWALHGLTITSWAWKGAQVMSQAINILVSFLLFPFVGMLLVFCHRVLPDPGRRRG